MGKFNLSSVYTSDNIYSVLKLLKALIDTLDTYSFEEPILDKDGNPIPMDWFKNLYNSIHGDSNGNVEIGKDAHVDGNINVDGQATIGKELNLGSRAFFAKVLSPSNTTTLPAIFVRNDNGSLSAFSFDPNRGYILLWEIFTADNIENEVYTTNRKPFIIDMDYLSNIDTTLNNMQSAISKISDGNSESLQATNTIGITDSSIYLTNRQLIIDAEDEIGSGNYYRFCVLDREDFSDGTHRCLAFFTSDSKCVCIDFDLFQISLLYLATYDYDNTFNICKIHSSQDIQAEYVLANTDQAKLIRHTISVTGGSVFGSFDFYNRDNTPIDSPQDLTAYLKPTTNSKYPCYCLTTDNPPNATQMNCIVYTNNVWKFATKTNTANIAGPSITTVSDIVTAVS